MVIVRKRKKELKKMVDAIISHFEDMEINGESEIRELDFELSELEENFEIDELPEEMEFLDDYEDLE